MIETLASQVVSGLATGCVYALVALGFVLIFKATDVVNFAQGEFIMASGFMSYTLLIWCGLPYWLVLLMTIPLSGLMGVILERIVVRPIMDAPIFSPDGQSIIFSALSPQQSSAPTWIEKLLGIQVAQAHSVPSDWWSVPLSGGAATQLTRIRAAGLFASISPDKRYIASYSAGGLFVMNPDGTNLTMLIPDTGGIIGTVSWMP